MFDACASSRWICEASTLVVINRETYRKRRKVLIISAMAAGCFLLFVLSVLISSRASCVCKKSSDRKKTSRKITTNVLASQIQRELAHASNI
jgi:ABC-type siderophore export system fused ATPase/permease subunit